MSHPSDSMDLIEIQLQQELRQMFELDSKIDLETYLTRVENLQNESWIADIQTMYRNIHTIKGSSVTVKADAILHVATVLEDLLSELRYLETAPNLEDGQLKEILLEGGEIIASVLDDRSVGSEAIELVQTKVDRIKNLHELVKENYLQDWDEQTQIQKEFALQGLEMVTMDLEISLNQLPSKGVVPESTIEIGRELIEQLTEIGEELELASGWTQLLDKASELLDNPDVGLWKSEWIKLFEELKASAQEGGKIVNNTNEKSQESPENVNLTDIDDFLDDINDYIDSNVRETTDNKQSSNEEKLETEGNIYLDEIDLSESEDLEQEDGIDEIESSFARQTIIDTLTPLPSKKSQKESVDINIQVPIPLTRLDNSAQSIVETLMISRTMESFYQELQNNLVKLVAIAKSNVQHISNLRQIEDDYALEDNPQSSDNENSQAPGRERYRKGYLTINRLLENNLRLSEIGTEAEQTAQETSEKLEQLSKSILRLKDIVEESRLVPFKNISFRVRAIIRDLMNRYGKSVKLVVEGEKIELDVGTTRKLEPMLLHLVRNAYDHALETPEERIAQGKTEQGIISLNLKRYGSTYILTLQDDGRGIDPHKIRAKAEKMNLPLTSTDTPSELLAVLCQPGFSSSSEVSEVSGRGVGMDVVREQIALLNGSLTLDTVLGKGTTFKIHFPVPHLLIPCLIMQSGDRTFAIATEQVIKTSLWSSLEKTKTEDSKYGWYILEDGIKTPGLDLLKYWYPKYNNLSLSENAIGIYVKSQFYESGIWLLTNKIIGRSELKIQPFPTPLIPPKGVMGVSLQADSTLLPVLEINSLMEHLSTELTKEEQQDDDEALIIEESQTILVVDDAALIRRRIEASLTAYGYTTRSCIDGLEAWNWLQINPQPTLIITDIEMPNLDGFGLIDRCRKANFTFPILVISSRLAQEWGEEAHRLGATDFLTKGFSTSEFINKVKSLL